MARPWSVEESARLYNLRRWGLGYFHVNEKGNVVCRPRRSPERSVDVKAVVDDVISRGVKLPVLVRFQDIVRDRVVTLNEAFKSAIQEHKYQGRYFGVYPIKVNQLREVVEEIADAGEPYQLGLEAGSKGELLAVVAMNGPDCLTVVNGYKDESMMRLACIGLKLGKRVIVVIEKLSELDTLLRVAASMGVRPQLGLRVKLQTEGSGKWKSSAGHSAKFGLTTPEVLAAVARLREEGLLDCAKLLHFHFGSQVTDIRTIKDAVREGARVYAKLRKSGVELEYLDCGGGLGVDYDGTGASRNNSNSMNYTLDEYVRDVVYSIQEVCVQEKVPEPHIVTESGRALVAHHALLVVNIFGSIEAGSTPIALDEAPGENRVVGEMRDIMKALSDENLDESYHDALQRMEEAQTMFKLGFLELEDRARVENLFWRLCVEIRSRMERTGATSQELKEMLKSLDDQYLVNFSIFQSLPDSWAIGHVFPVVPLHRHEEKPLRRAALVDITCDSDGKISQYVFGGKTSRTLAVHQLDGKPYYVGIFLMGAYQATMGDIHNLFGRVNEVHVFEDEEEPGGYYIEEVIHGQTVRDVLASIQYSDFELAKMVKQSVEARVKAGALKPREGVDLLDLYEAALQEYTYIDHNGSGAGSGPRPAAESAQSPSPAESPLADSPTRG